MARVLRTLPLVVISFVILSGILSAQVTINVPADIPTIQGAINAAHNGDTVLVAPGTYFENLDFVGKAITVKSSDGPTLTIIDGGSQGPVIRFANNEFAAAV